MSDIDDMRHALAIRDELVKEIRAKGDSDGMGSPKVRVPHARIIAEHLITEGLVNIGALSERVPAAADEPPE